MLHFPAIDTPYDPTAIYYEEADMVEYVRRDVPAVHERVDALLTLIFEMDNRQELIGFQIKGFRSLYQRNPVPERLNRQFMSLVGIIERVVTDLGDVLFEDQGRQQAYGLAYDLASSDHVKLSDLPLGAAH